MIPLILVFINSGSCTTTSPSQCYPISRNPEASVTGEELLVCMYLLHRDLALTGRYKNHYDFSLIEFDLNHILYFTLSQSSYDCPTFASYNLGENSWELHPSQSILPITAQDVMEFTLPPDPPWGTEKMRLQRHQSKYSLRRKKIFDIPQINTKRYQDTFIPSMCCRQNK